MSLARSSVPLLALLAAPLFVACGYGDHVSHGSDGYSPDPAPSAPVEESTIDADELIDVEPGAGAGAYVEYESGGTYHLTTSCGDVATNGACYWDIIVTPLGDAALLSAAPVSLESDDSVILGAGNQLRLVAYTSKDVDGVTFQTEPGAAIQVDALLDNGSAHQYLFWVGGGALHSGAPSNPIDLVPSAE